MASSKLDSTQANHRLAQDFMVSSKKFSPLTTLGDFLHISQSWSNHAGALILYLMGTSVASPLVAIIARLIT